jgi:putative photosynthetic complex assembly protein
MTARVPAKSPTRAPIYIGLALALVTLAVTDFGGLIGGAGATSQLGTPALTRDLTFTDRADGSILVREAGTEAPVTVLAPTTNAFIRGTLRALVRSRRAADLGHDAPFRLTAFRTGALVLEDRATGHQVAIDAFGETNRDAFARLLTARDPAQ